MKQCFLEVSVILLCEHFYFSTPPLTGEGDMCVSAAVGCAFNDAFSSSNYIASNDRTIIEKINWKGYGRKRKWANLKYYHGICDERYHGTQNAALELYVYLRKH